MLRVAVSAVLALALGGCGQSVVAGPLTPEEVGRTTPGARLRALQWVPVDGTAAPIPGRFEDRELGRCSVTPLSEDGITRCMPGGYPSFLFATGGGPPFVDPECSTAIVQDYERCPLEPVIFRDAQRGPGGRIAVERAYRITDRPGDVSAALYDRVDFGDDAGTCGPMPESFRETELFFAWEAYVLAERVPEGSMVGVETREETDLGGGLRDVTRRFADGTVERVRAVDTPCTAYRTGDGAVRCLPVAGSILPAYADEGCTELVWLAPTSFELEAGRGFVWNEGRTVVREVREIVGAPTTVTTTFNLREDRCLRSEREVEIVRLTDPLPLTSFPALRREAVGRGRLRPVRLLDEAGRAWPVRPLDRSLEPDALVSELIGWTYRDTAEGFDCVGFPTVDGVRCLPLGTLRVDELTPRQTFGDPACTEPVLFAFGPEAARVTHVADLGTFGEGCDRRSGVLRMRRVGARLPAGSPVYYATEAGPCEEGPAVPEGENVVYYRLNGGEVPLSRFGAFRESVWVGF
ncbi:MAG: hypothetical protein AAGH15_06470 [Myxococcota bacterium]